VSGQDVLMSGSTTAEVREVSTQKLDTEMENPSAFQGS
jgi:hypothetical protein